MPRTTTAEHLIPGDLIAFTPGGPAWTVEANDRVQVEMAPPVFHRILTVEGGLTGHRVQFDVSENVVVDVLQKGF